MKRGGGRAKGNAFEREVARQIVAKFADKGITAKDCYRTPLSGGHVHASKESPSDLVISKKLARYFPYAVECKFYKEIKFEALLDPTCKGSLFPIWWAQIKKSVRSYQGPVRPRPCLIFKQNRSDIYVMVRWVDYPADFDQPFVSAIVGKSRVKVARFVDFLETVRTCS